MNTRFHPLPGNSFLKLDIDFTNVAHMSFHPLPGNSFLKLDRAETTVRMDAVSIPFRGIHFLNEENMRATFELDSFHPLPGNSFLKQKVQRKTCSKNGMFPSPSGEFIS